MRYWNVADRRYAAFSRLSAIAGLSHAFSTRPHDVSARGDGLAGERDLRRRQMARDLELSPQHLAWCVQVHTPRVRVVTPGDAGGALEGVDGVCTAVADTPLMCFSADCPLVLLVDPWRRVLGLAHASWRCTVGRIVVALLDEMRTAFGIRPGDLLAGIGPSAGPCCYEVQQDVRDAAASLPGGDGLFPRRAGRMYFDLWTANARLLAAAGVRAENIEVAGVCTMCRGDVFYSFRREGPGCGHFGLMAGLSRTPRAVTPDA